MRTLLLICCLGTLGALSAPVRADDTPASLTHHLEIAVWYDGGSGSLGPLGDLCWLFQQRHKEVMVNLRRYPTLTAYGLLTRWTTIDPGGAPDLLVISSSWITQFKDSLVTLDELATGPAAKKFVPGALELFTVDGHLRAVPWSLAARVLVVRSDLLEEKKLQAPGDWKQVAEVAAALHDPPQLYGLGLPGRENGGGAALLQEMMWAEEDALLGPTGETDFTSEGKVRALERYAELTKSAQPEILTWTQSDLEGLFAAGRLGMVVTDTWAARSWRGAQGMPAFQVLPLPGGRRPVGHLLGDGLAVFGKSPERELALQFVQTVLQPQAQRKLVEWGGLPVHQNLLNEAAKGPFLSAVLPTVPQARIVPPFQPRALNQALDYALHLALSGRASPAQALAAAQNALRGQTTPTTPGAPPGVG